MLRPHLWIPTEKNSDGINEEGDKLKELEILQNKLDEMEATDNDNFTIDIHRAINALNMSHDKNVKANKVIKQTLHHKNIWHFSIVGAIGMAVGIIFIMAFIFNKVKHRVINITYINNSSKCRDSQH